VWVRGVFRAAFANPKKKQKKKKRKDNKIMRFVAKKKKKKLAGRARVFPNRVVFASSFFFVDGGGGRVYLTALISTSEVFCHPLLLQRGTAPRRDGWMPTVDISLTSVG
jgi:hypothetical protein